MGTMGLSPGSFTTFGEMLRVMRRRAHLTQGELGIAVGYSGTFITRLESNARQPDPSTVRALFVDALKLEDEPELARRLVELADLARQKSRVPTMSGALPNPANPHSVVQLPAYLTRFIGRSHELAEVAGLLATSRLVTLTGCGGAGKTRLALEVVAAVVGAMRRLDGSADQSDLGGASPLQFSDGVCLVELASLADSGLVGDAIVSALRLRTSNRPAQDVLIEHWHNRQALLLLDNCEHLVSACAELAEVLLRACPHLRILATSRERLNLQGEMAWRVPSLSTDEAVQLFTERARDAQPDFTLVPENTVVVRAICQRLDGIPLAIELAAAHLNGMSVDELARRLRDRFLLLAAGSRTMLPRHRTLRAAIDWSYDLLSEPERAVWCRLAAFAGGWIAEAMEQVCEPRKDVAAAISIPVPDAMSLLLSLVDKSLVVVEDRQGETRYRLLETLREYAWEQLAARGETEDACREHARYYLALVQETAPREMQESGAPMQFALLSETSAWRERLSAERDNLRAALAWSLRDARELQDVDQGVQLALWLYAFWSIQGPHSEGREWLERALMRTDPVARSQTRARLLCVLANFASDTGDTASAEAASHEALAICRELGNRFDLMIALWCCTQNTMRRGDLDEAMAMAEEWLFAARELGNQRYAGVALFYLGIIALRQNDLPRAAALMEESMRVLPASDVGARIIARFHQGMVALDQGDVATASENGAEGLAYFRKTGFAGGTATALHMLGDVALLRGEVALARQHYCDGLTILYQDGFRQRSIWCLEGLAAVAAAERQDERAATLWVAAEALRAMTDSKDFTICHAAYSARVDAAIGRLNSHELAAAQAAGHTMTYEEVVRYALAQAPLAQ